MGRSGRSRGRERGEPEFPPRADAMLTARLLRLAELRSAEQPPSAFVRLAHRARRAVVPAAAALAVGAGALAVHALAPGLHGPGAGVARAGLLLAPLGATLGGAGLWRRRRMPKV